MDKVERLARGHKIVPATRMPSPGIRETSVVSDEKARDTYNLINLIRQRELQSQFL